MPGNLQGRKLLIISDTAVCKTGDGYLAFEPVLREAEALSVLFDEITWLGCKVVPDSTVLKSVNNSKIKMVQMPAVRHKFLNPLLVLLAYPVFIFYILKYLPHVTHVHTRAPSHPAWLGIILSRYDRHRVYWHKYAGNWVAARLAFTYERQRKLLQRLYVPNVKITVNGNWSQSNKNILPFENPCLTEQELTESGFIAGKKDFSCDLNLLFVGALNKEKGILELIEAIETGKLPAAINEVFIAGDGPLTSTVRQRTQSITQPKISLLGTLSRTQLDDYYAQSHLLVLPSTSEGFPKVVAEAAAFGCIPVVTNISSVSQYIADGVNGFLMENNTPATISETLRRAVQSNLKKISMDATVICERFTYERFISRLKTEIFP